MYLFETPRLKVRALSMQDLPALTAILSDPAVYPVVRGLLCLIGHWPLGA